MRRKFFWFLLAAAIVAGLLFFSFRQDRTSAPNSPSAQARPTPGPQNKGGIAAPGPEASGTATGPTAVQSGSAAGADPLVAFIAAFGPRFAAARSLEEKLTLYAELRDLILRSKDPRETAESIAAFLAGGEDAPTGLGFAVGPDGFLDTAPTLRTALLDMVADLDAAIALQLAREILDARSDPDEYALALRNMAWSPLFPSESEREMEVSRRFTALLDMEDWLARPSVGFAESFDVAVAMPNPQTVNDLASVVALEDTTGNRTDNGVSTAAIIALERVMLRDPKLLVSSFEKDPSFLAQEPRLRAVLMAGLDLRQRRQFDLFANYLARTDLADGELEFFGDFFPNTTYSFGPRLISRQEDVPTLAGMQEADRAYLALILAARNSGQLRDSTALQSIVTNLQRRVEEANEAAKVPPVTSAPVGSAPTTAALLPNSGSGAPGRVRKVP